MEKNMIEGAKPEKIAKLGGQVSGSGYEKGKKIETLVEFANRIQERKPFYWRHKFMAAGFIENWPIVQISNSIKYGVLRSADKITEYLRQGEGM